MKEFIEKLIERLEGLRRAESDKCKEYANLNMGDFLEKYNHGEYCYKNAISIVNQLAEEYNKREFYEITLNGCDDNTTFVMAMTELEHEFLIRVSQKANKTSTYGCMPRLYVEKAEMIELKGE